MWYAPLLLAPAYSIASVIMVNELTFWGDDRSGRLPSLRHSRTARTAGRLLVKAVAVSAKGDPAINYHGRFDWPLSVFKVDFNTCH
jgi:hypothetical protein